MGWGKLANRVARVVLALLALVAGAPALAQAGSPVAVCIKRAQLDDPRAESVLERAAGFDCRTPQVAWGPGDYWALSRPIGARAGETLLVRNYGVWQTGSALWARYADGSTARLAPVSYTGSLGTGVEHLLPARKSAPVRLLWRVEGAGNTRGVVLGARIFTQGEYARRNTSVGMVVGWFAGLCVAFLFLNAVLWIALRRTFQIAYCAMTSGLLLYVLADAGFVRRLLPDLGSTAALKITGLTFTLCVVGGLWFARSFLEPDVVGRPLKRFNQAVAGSMFAAALVQSALPPSRMLWIDRAQATTFLLALAALAALVWRAWSKRSAFRWIWSTTVIVPAMLAGMRAANSFPALGTLFAMQERMLAMMTMGMFASSLAIAYRVHLIARERDRAREQEIAARLLADTDPLTGLLNRRAFLRTAIGRPGEQALLLIDVDHFKAVNDTVGHDAGDDVLRAVARALGQAAGVDTLVARVGGEEFAIVAAVDRAPDPLIVLARLRAEPMPFDLDVTASIGVCTGPLSTEADWKELYRKADRALLDAKRSGRDRVRRALAA